MGQHGQSRWIIYCTLLIALLLALVPLPEWARYARPEFVSLVLIYWIIALPESVGVFTAFICGIFLDLIEGAPLGQNAFALLILAYLSLILYQRLRMFIAWQQAATVFVLIGVNQLVCHWVQSIKHEPSGSTIFLLPALTSALIWPWLMPLLRNLRRSYEVR